MPDPNNNDNNGNNPQNQQQNQPDQQNQQQNQQQNPPTQQTSQTGQQGQQGQSASQPAGQTYTIKVNGEERTMTLDELRKAAEKTGGADAKMEEAAQLRKQAEEAMALKHNLDRLKESGDPQLLQSVMKDLGADEEVVQQVLDMVQKQQGQQGQQSQQGQEGQSGETITDENGNPIYIEPDDLSPQLRKELDEFKQWKEQQTERSQKKEAAELRQEIQNKTYEGVDNDEIFGKIENDEQRQTVKDLVFKEVQRRVVADGESWPDVLEPALQSVRQIVQNFGSHGATAKQTGQAGPEGPTNPFANPAIGPAAALGQTAESTAPTERPSAADTEKYEKYLGGRVRQFIKAKRNALHKQK